MDPFSEWLAALDDRHRQALSFQEVRRGAQALSSLYVETKLQGGIMSREGGFNLCAANWRPERAETMRRVTSRAGYANARKRSARNHCRRYVPLRGV
jgi:hypothetical protein